MREIKFRAWDKVRKCWIWKPRWQVCYNDANTELVQYTGFKDKNGKEIYEGDIIIPAPNEWNEPPYIVEFSVGAFTFTRPHTIVKTFWEAGTEFEIIGNIYENPELQKEK